MNLAFPSGVAPGFDPSHMASQGALFSGVPMGGANIVNLLTGKPGTSNGGANAPTAANHGMLGPTIYIPNNGNITFPYPATTWTAQTMAAIIVFDASSSANIRNILSTSASGVGGFLLAMSNTGTGWSEQLGGTFLTFSSGLQGQALVAGVPYFYAVSAQTVKPINSALCRLDTGQMSAISAANANTFDASDTSLYIGNRGLNTRQTVGKIAAAMHANNYLSPQQLQQWAADPWAFWYPQK